MRKFDPAPLLPLIEELFVQGALALHAAANCDNEAAKDMLVAIDELNASAWNITTASRSRCGSNGCSKLADADDRNPLLSGYACAILLERGLIANEDLAREVSRRLSPGIPADLGAGWFEGLAKRNRYALLARQPLWEELAERTSQSLDEDQFQRALVFLRRAFGGFSPHEKRHISENLANLGPARRRRERGDREAADRGGREDAQGLERVQFRRSVGCLTTDDTDGTDGQFE